MYVDLFLISRENLKIVIFYIRFYIVKIGYYVFVSFGRFFKRGKKIKKKKVKVIILVIKEGVRINR